MGDALRYWVGFSCVHGIGAARISLLRRFFGDLETAWHATADEYARAGLGPKTIEALIETRQRLDLDEELRRIDRMGFRVVTIEDEAYPTRLLEIDAPPPVLYLWGEVAEADRWAVAVVGTRRPSRYGRSVAGEIGRELAASGLTVISGLARGIDGIAHQAALEAGGRTVAVLGSGLDVIYPPEHRGLAAKIARQGAVISDYALGTKPEGRNFPPRNRIISGLSMAVVIVEAGESSGALITADFAVDQGREVFAVPGDITRRSSRGTNALIQAGAHPWLGVQDALEILNLEMMAVQTEASETLPEDDIERTLLEILGRDPLHVDEIRARSQLTSAQVNAGLAMLELKGRARQVGGMHYVRLREAGLPYRVD